MLPDEYNSLYTNNPQKWENETHDQLVFASMASYGEPDKLLEIGCGNGHTLAKFVGHWPNVEYVGLDFSSVAISLCSENVPGAELICGDVMEYNPSGKFDMILLVGVAEHFDDPVEKLEYIHQKLLKSGGKMYMEVPNCRAYSQAPEGEGFHRIGCGSNQLEWHYSRESWEQIIEDAGFEIVEKLTGPRKHNEFIWILTR